MVQERLNSNLYGVKIKIPPGKIVPRSLLTCKRRLVYCKIKKQGPAPTRKICEHLVYIGMEYGTLNRDICSRKSYRNRALIVETVVLYKWGLRTTMDKYIIATCLFISLISPRVFLQVQSLLHSSCLTGLVCKASLYGLVFSIFCFQLSKWWRPDIKSR